MSDIQRYHPTWGTAEGYNMTPIEAGYYVKYDDHIAEMKEKDKWFNDEFEFLKCENAKLQARIDELEAEIETRKNIVAFCIGEKNQIIADGVEEMCKKLYNKGKSLSEFNIKEYANKLRGEG